MNGRLLDRLVTKSIELIDKPVSARSKHFSYIIKKNRIMSIGWNLSTKTHPLAKKFGNRFSRIHAETMAVRKFPYPPELLKECCMVNLRLGKKNKLLLSKPCSFCYRLLEHMELKSVMYTNNESKFITLW